MSRWFLINVIVIGLAIWKVSTGYFGVHILFGLLGFSFFLINWMRHAIFATIRSKIKRTTKIKLAKLSKKAMPFHKWTGTIAFVFILIHMILVIRTFGFQPNNYKMMFGLMACLMMFLTVLFGWIRWLRTTVNRRIIHLSLAFTLFYLIVIHLLL